MQDEGPRHPNTLFRAIDRIKLIMSIIEARVNVGGSGLSLARELSIVPLLTYFPLHQVFMV